MSEEAEWLSYREAAKLINVSLRTIKRWACLGYFTPVRWSASVVRLKKSEILEKIANLREAERSRLKNLGATQKTA